MDWVDFIRIRVRVEKAKCEEWDKWRTLFSLVINVNASKPSDRKTPKQVLPLWTDELAIRLKPKRIQPSKEEVERLKQAIKDKNNE